MRRTIAIGPELLEFGSWNWVGRALVDAVSEQFDITMYSDLSQIPEADIVVFLKFKPRSDELQRLRTRSRLVFVPVDVYGSAGEIDADLPALRSLDLVALHSRRLQRYLEGLVNCSYVDHPLKYVLPDIRTGLMEGPLLWVGKACNLGPVIPFLNAVCPTNPVEVLTDLDSMDASAHTAGLLSDSNLTVSRWTEKQHLHSLISARAAIDIKGSDFRARNKPPAKAFDFFASGIPVITNRGSIVDLHAGELGHSALHTDNWEQHLTEVHQHSVHRMAERLRERCSTGCVADAWLRILGDLSQQR
jgi:hypothetical protein